MNGEAQKNLQMLQDFFKQDEEIKKILINILQARDSLVGTYQMQRFLRLLDRANDQFQKVFQNFLPLLELSSEEHTNLFKNFVSYFFQKLQEDLQKCDCTEMGIYTVVTKRFSSLKPEFLDIVYQNCVANKVAFDFKKIEETCTSINELLHFYHAYIINKLNYSKVFPILFEKNNIVLCGEETAFSKNVFDKFPADLKSRYVRILSYDENFVYAIVRDYGHATSLKIKKDHEQVYVEYFIPTVTNFEKIQELPGLNRVSKYDDTGWATGSFRGNLEDLEEFIQKIPTDFDIKKVFK